MTLNNLSSDLSLYGPVQHFSLHLYPCAYVLTLRPSELVCLCKGTVHFNVHLCQTSLGSSVPLIAQICSAEVCNKDWVTHVGTQKEDRLPLLLTPVPKILTLNP